MPGRLPAAVVLLIATTLSAAGGGCWDTAPRCHDVNDRRAVHDRPRLDQAAGMQHGAGDWADELAASGVLRHDPDTGASEIVGVGSGWAAVLTAFMRSDRHRRVLLGRHERVGIGVQRAGGMTWAVVRFR